MGLQPSAKCTSTVNKQKFRWKIVPHSRQRLGKSAMENRGWKWNVL